MEGTKQTKIKVLHYIKHLGSGGGETLLYNIYQNIDRDKVQFDFLVNCAKEEKLDAKIIELGGRKIPLIEREPKFTPIKIILVMRNLKRMLWNGSYSIVHIHCSNGQGLLYSYIARSAGVKNVIVHIHNTDVDGRFRFLKKLFHNICKKAFQNAPTEKIACSELAAKWLYDRRTVENKNYMLLKNGIDIDKYVFQKSIRDEYREKAGWKSRKIIINVGRMEEQKNQIFLLKVFSEILKKDDNYRLIIIGRGSLEKKISNKIAGLMLDDMVKVIPYTNEVEKYLWASDLFLLPSLSEGLGIVAIEAQAAGLPTVVSDTVPKEAFVTDLISSISLDENDKQWAEEIVNICLNDRRDDRYAKAVRNAGYDIKDTSIRLLNLYEKCSNQSQRLDVQ